VEWSVIEHWPENVTVAAEPHFTERYTVAYAELAVEPEPPEPAEPEVDGTAEPPHPERTAQAAPAARNDRMKPPSQRGDHGRPPLAQG
jgi:hypothetical protein